jgi:predicted NodU family carbamoyl transferase
MSRLQKPAMEILDALGSEDRLNRVKARKWYRPVAPMIAEEALQRVFGKHVHSPYMSMAPKVQDGFGMFCFFFDLLFG